MAADSSWAKCTVIVFSWFFFFFPDKINEGQNIKNWNPNLGSSVSSSVPQTGLIFKDVERATNPTESDEYFGIDFQG